MNKRKWILQVVVNPVVAVFLTLGAVEARAQDTTGPAVPPAPDAAKTVTVPAPAAATDGPNVPPLLPDSNERGLRFNFRGVPLDTVLDYLSASAGFVIVRQADVRGTVDIVSHQTLNKDEAVAILNTILNEKKLAAIRNGRTLTIVTRDEAKKRNLPVRRGADPEEIPNNDEMVIHIIPVQRAEAARLVENLTPLLPEYATITANVSSNAIILTGTQTDIRRMAEIIRALDTSISEASTMKVYTIQRASARELATLINTLFASQQRSGSGQMSDSDRVREFLSRMRGGGGPGGPGDFQPGGGFPGGPGGPSGSERGGGRGR